MPHAPGGNLLVAASLPRKSFKGNGGPQIRDKAKMFRIIDEALPACRRNKSSLVNLAQNWPTILNESIKHTQMKSFEKRAHLEEGIIRCVFQGPQAVMGFVVHGWKIGKWRRLNKSGQEGKQGCRIIRPQ